MADNLELLLNAVVEQAADDYREALCRWHQTGSEMDRDEVERLERWFTGREINRFTTLDGEALMRGIERQCFDFNYDLNAIKKTLGKCRKEEDEEEEKEES